MLKILTVTIPIICYTCGFDPNTEFSRHLLKIHVVCEQAQTLKQCFNNVTASFSH